MDFAEALQRLKDEQRRIWNQTERTASDDTLGRALDIVLYQYRPCFRCGKPVTSHTAIWPHPDRACQGFVA